MTTETTVPNPEAFQGVPLATLEARLRSKLAGLDPALVAKHPPLADIARVAKILVGE